MRISFLFLDFDGVLHPGLSGTFINLPLLVEFLEEQPQVRIVLSSSWRLEQPLSALKEYFPAAVQPRILGCTPELPGGSRYGEILHWLRHEGVTLSKWAALDDDSALFPQFCDQLVLCKTSKGLERAQLKRLAELL